MLMKLLKDAFMSSVPSKMGALLAQGSLAQLKEKVSPDTYGGSPLLGVKGISIVGHGSSNANAIKNGILTGVREVRGRLDEVIAEVISQDGGASR